MRAYLLTVAAAAGLFSLLVTVLPDGRVRKTAQFTGALLLILTVLAPIMKLDSDDFARAIAKVQIDTSAFRRDTKNNDRELIAQLIKEESQTYILDKAAELGINVTAEVTLSEGSEYPYPVSVVLRGSPSEQAQNRLSSIIECDLGIPPDRQEWIDNQ